MREQQLSFDIVRRIVKRTQGSPVTSAGTGEVLEQMAMPALEYGGYAPIRKVHVGPRLGAGRHIMDIVARDSDGTPIYVSLKWQQVGGTAEQKVPYEAMCLIETIRAFNLNHTGDVNGPSRGYIVLGGSGWTMREWLSTQLQEYLRDGHLVQVLDLYEFVARANKRTL